MTTQPNPGAFPSAIGRRMRSISRFIELGDKAAAMNGLRELIQANPDMAAPKLQLAELYLESENNTEARNLVMQAVADIIDSPNTGLSLLNNLGALSESKLIIDICRELTPERWGSAHMLTLVAQQLSLAGINTLALKFAQAAVSQDRDYPPGLYMLATMELMFGDLHSAETHVKQCLKWIPDDPGSHWLLSRLRLPDAASRIETIRNLLPKTTTIDAKIWLSFALHNELHDAKEYDAAWKVLMDGSALKKAQLGYHKNHYDSIFDNLMKWNSSDLAIDDGYIDSSLKPVFVLGLHRSGTTLADQVLSGHSGVTSGGETYDIRARLRQLSGLHFAGETDLRVIERRSSIDYQKLGRSYINGMRWRSAGKAIVTDKLPSNYFNIGFIARSLPEAKFIVLRRDPVDVGFSSLRTLFSHACPYSYEQTDFAHYFLQYSRLMAHWKTVLGDRVLEVDYQQLVETPETVAASMAQFCGLPYQPEMINVGSRQEAVATASSVMIRDGIRKDRGKVWKNYQQFLEPMQAALEQAI